MHCVVIKWLSDGLINFTLLSALLKHRFWENSETKSVLDNEVSLSFFVWKQQECAGTLATTRNLQNYANCNYIDRILYELPSL